MTEIRPIEGKSKILFFRRLADRDKKDGIKLALQTEHNWEYENDVETEPTKDGAVNASGSVEASLNFSAVLTNSELSTMLEDAVIKGETIEVWDVNLAGEKQDDKYPCKYARGKLTNWEDPAEVGEFAMIETEMKVDGVPLKGFTSIPEGKAEEINYVFEELMRSENPEEL